MADAVRETINSDAMLAKAAPVTWGSFFLLAIPNNHHHFLGF